MRMAEPTSTCSPSSSPSSPGDAQTESMGQPGAVRVKTEPQSSYPDTPTKRNKRKMSEPKKRSDFSIKRFCPDLSPGTSDAEQDSSRDDVFGVSREFPPDTPDTSTPDPDDSMQGEDYKYLVRVPGHRLPEPMGLGRRPSFYDPRDNSMGMGEVSPGGSHGEEEMYRYDTMGRPIKKGRKNYKNMTRERRVEANARERSRVHTISAAFDSLRRAVPSYSYNQKLSKLAILRIASSYIMALARLADLDYSKGEDNLSFGDCVDMCTKTIQTEGRARRRH